MKINYRRICKTAFALIMSFGMMVNYCVPTYAKQVEDQILDELKTKIENVDIKDRDDTNSEVSIEVTFSNDDGITDTKLDVNNNDDVITVENPDIKDDDNSDNTVYTFEQEYEIGDYTIESIELKYNDEEYKIDVKDLQEDTDDSDKYKNTFSVIRLQEPEIEVEQPTYIESEKEEQNDNEKSMKDDVFDIKDESNEEAGASFDSAIVLSEGTSESITLTNEITYFSFTPTKDSYYTIESISTYDTYGYLYNSSKTKITSNNDSGDGSNFWIKYNLEANKTYYIGAKMYSSTVTGSVQIKVGEYIAPTSGTCGGNLTWKLDDEGALTINGTGSMTSVPWSDSMTLIKSVSLPSGLTSIKSYAFDGCSNLTSITIPNSVTSLESYSFNGCSGLTSITIPDSVTKIGFCAFYGCSKLKSITISNNVTSINGYTFAMCTGLTSITIPDSVTSIGAGAFGGCSSLTSIIIPDIVTSIGSDAFRYCSSLTRVYCNTLESYLKIKYGNSYSHPFFESNTGSLYINGTLATDIVIPSSITSIRDYAFYGCSSLTNIIIPNSVTSIGDYSFYECSLLKIISISSSVESIGSNAFLCTSLATSKDRTFYLHKNSYADTFFDDSNNKVYLDDANTLEEQIKEIQEKIDELEPSINDGSAQTAHETQQAKGSLGFYESILNDENETESNKADAQAAINVINKHLTSLKESNPSNVSNLNRYYSTDLGADGDATSLDNMLAAYNYLTYCNQLRVSEGLSEYSVNNYMMAAAQVQCNGSGVIYGHTLYEASVGENLIGSYKVENPETCYKAWYYDEKETYESEEYQNALTEYNAAQTAYLEAKKAGIDTTAVYITYCEKSQALSKYTVDHYLNLIDCNGVTGLALTENTMNGYNCKFNINQTFHSGNSYTVDEYFAKLQVYINSDPIVEYNELCVKKAALENALEDCQTNNDEKLEGYSLSLSGEIGVNFYMSLSDSIVKDTGSYVEFTLPNGTTSQVNVKDALTDTVNDHTYYVFKCYVSAKDMVSEIKVQLHVSDGSAGEEYTYTVKEYADYILSHYESTSSEYKIAQNMLNYGTYSQVYFKYKTDNLPTPPGELEEKNLNNYNKLVPIERTLLESNGYPILWVFFVIWLLDLRKVKLKF